ncbi:MULTISPECIES: penicillin acylase family protein [Peribacillus]|uniref:penicillin acylase family protein n=1 Tax=Peribacillus TaxID=2675229 RepID=UPI0009E97457
MNTRGSPAVSKIDERIPTPGTGEYEWKGFIPFKENPHVINPKNGYVVNWNNKPAKEWTNGEYSFYHFPPEDSLFKSVKGESPTVRGR